MKKLSLFFIIVLFFLYQSCTSKFSLKKGPIFAFHEIKIEETPSKDDYPDANAIYSHREGKYEIQTISTFSEHIIIKVLKKGGQKHANIKIPFWEDCEVLDLKARTIKPNGEIVNLNEANIFEVSDFPDYILYADRKAKVFTFPAVDTGCVLEYIYTLGYRGPYVPIWYFQGDEPTLLAKFTYDVPRFLGFDYILSKLPNFDIDKDILDTGDRHKATFTAKNLPMLKFEPLSPSINDISSWILMSWSSFRHFFLGEIRSGQESWYEIGKNYSLITDTLLKPTKVIKAKTDKIIIGCSSDEDKIKKIYKFVRDNFRYVAVDIEGHRMIPNVPEEVLENQYGDCKDLSGLLISMLSTVGIDAYPVLVKTKDAGKFIERFPSLSQINHVIVAIALKHFADEVSIKNAIVYDEIYFSNAGDYVIVDPTVPTYSIRQLHSEIQGRNAILCAGYDSRLMIFPAGNFKRNFCSTKIIFNLNSDNYHGEIQIKLGGEDAARLRYQFLHSSHSEIRDYLQDYISEFPLMITLDTFELSFVKDLDSSLTIDMRFTKLSPLQTSKNQVLIPVMFKSSSQFKDIYSCHKRTHNIEFDYPYMRSDVFKLIVPKEFKLYSLPEKETVKNKWCEYTCLSYVCGDTVIVNRNVAVPEHSIPKEDFTEIKKFAAKVLDSSHKVVILSKK